MRKIFLRTLVLFLLAGMMPVMADDVVYINTAQFRERIFDYKTERDWKYKGNKPCVIDFYTTWCGPCKRLAPIMEELSQTYCDRVVFYKADTERERELAYVFNISSIPQVLYIPTEGKPMLLKGLYPKEEIVRIINDFLLTSKTPEPEPEPVEEVKQEEPEPKMKWWERLKYKVKRNKKETK